MGSRFREFDSVLESGKTYESYIVDDGVVSIEVCILITDKNAYCIPVDGIDLEVLDEILQMDESQLLNNLGTSSSPYDVLQIYDKVGDDWFTLFGSQIIFKYYGN